MTAVRFPDGQLAVRNLLRALLAGRTEPEALGVTVSTRVPEGETSPPLPYIAVRSDNAGRDARLNGYAVVRLTVWHRDEGLAMNLAGLAEALLLDASGGDVRAVQSTAGPIPATDPDSDAPTAFFRVTARLRPHIL